MKAILILAVSCALGLLCVAQKATGSAADSLHAPAAVVSAQATPPQAGSGADELERVLVRMDQTSAEFKNAQADFVWDQYDRVVEAHDRQSGSIYFRRNVSKLEM